MDASDTQVESFQKVQKTALNRRMQVFKAILENPDLSRKELAKLTGIRLQSVCGRVNELIKSGMVVESGIKYDEDTDRNVASLREA